MPNIYFEGDCDQELRLLEFQGEFNKLEKAELGELKNSGSQYQLHCGNKYISGSEGPVAETLVVFKRKPQMDLNILTCVGRIATRVNFNKDPNFYE